MARSERINEPISLGGLVNAERGRIIDAASPERRAELAQAERSREVYRAWNAVCAGTREGDHVTGLHYLPSSNELVVYLDAPGWTQEMTMLREIIRARMEEQGVRLAGFIFRTSKAGYHPRRVSGASAARSSSSRPPAPRADLSDDELSALDQAVAPITDEKLAQALKKAMKASAEWKKGQEAQNQP